MGQVGTSQDNNMVMSSMGGESRRHIDNLKVLVVVICDPRVISLISIGCGSSHRFHNQCMYIQRKAATSNPPDAYNATFVFSVIHMSICSI